MAGSRSPVRSAVRTALRARGIPRILIAFGTFRAAEFGVWIATTAVAFEFGGVREATAVLVAQLLPAVATASLVGGWSDRWGERKVLVAGMYVQSVAMASIGILLALDAPRVAAYAGAVVATSAVSTTRPAISALVPLLVPGPRELSAANVAIGWLDGAATLIGPAITAICIATIGPNAPFLVFAVAVALAATVAIAIPEAARAAKTGSPDIPVRDALAAVARAESSRSVLVLLASRAFVEGALDLLYVVIALDVLGGSGADAGWLNAAYGAGALVGASASVVLVGRLALWPAAAAGALVAALGLVALGTTDTNATAAIAFVVIGVGTSVLLIAARTLLQRVTDLRLLCHAFSLAEAGDDTMLLVGSLSIPLIVTVASPQWAGAAVAGVFLLAVGSQIRTAAIADRRAHAPLAEIELLHRLELFAVLSAPALETLAREARPVSLAPGTVIVKEGEPGAEFYAIREGEVAVDRAGERIAVRTAGDGFGELALLFDVPRTATVTAITPVELLAIGRDAFLVAVTGEQATVHSVATHIETFDHSLGSWRPNPDAELDSDA